jgi:branched-chain amino acid transport system substrate-binding protein
MSVRSAHPRLRHLWLAVLVVAFALSGAGGTLLSSTFAQDKVAKIGVMVPLTGAFGADAEDVVNAAQLAVDDYNAAGGVAGYKLEVVPADTVDQRSDAVTSAYTRLKNEPDLNFIMTAYASTSNFEIDLLAADNMPYLISANAAQTRDIISKDPSKYPTIWSRVPSYDSYETELPKLLEKFSEQGKITFDHNRTAYIISSDDPYGSTIANGLRENFEALGWTISGFETVPFQSVTDWRGLLAKIRANPPDIVINTDSAPPNNAAFLNQFMEDPTDSLVFLQYGPSVPEFIELTEENSTGVLYNLLGAAIDSLPETEEIRDKYEERYGHRGGYFAVAAYNEVQLYATCLEQVGDATDRLAIGECIGNLDVMTPSGRMKFDPETHLAMFGEDLQPLLFYQIWEGERIIIDPERYANGEFRLPPWMEK